MKDKQRSTYACLCFAMQEQGTTLTVEERLDLWDALERLREDPDPGRRTLMALRDFVQNLHLRACLRLLSIEKEASVWMLEQGGVV